METPERDSSVRALRGLTIAVWALTAVMAVFVTLYLVAYIPSFTFSSVNLTRSTVAESERPLGSFTRYPDFHAMPLEKQIEAASVIAIARYERESERNKCVLSEILKQAPGTEFHFKLGDELRHCSHNVKPSESRGDGQLMFFVGSPADLRFSRTFFGERLAGSGNMPISLLRKQIGDQPPPK